MGRLEILATTRDVHDFVTIKHDITRGRLETLLDETTIHDWQFLAAFESSVDAQYANPRQNLSFPSTTTAATMQ